MNKDVGQKINMIKWKNMNDTIGWSKNKRKILIFRTSTHL